MSSYLFGRLEFLQQVEVSETDAFRRPLLGFGHLVIFGINQIELFEHFIWQLSNQVIRLLKLLRRELHLLGPLLEYWQMILADL